jgi:hypothetical protein
MISASALRKLRTQAKRDPRFARLLEVAPMQALQQAQLTLEESRALRALGAHGIRTTVAAATRARALEVSIFDGRRLWVMPAARAWAHVDKLHALATDMTNPRRASVARRALVMARDSILGHLAASDEETRAIVVSSLARHAGSEGATPATQALLSSVPNGKTSSRRVTLPDLSTRLPTVFNQQGAPFGQGGTNAAEGSGTPTGTAGSGVPPGTSMTSPSTVRLPTLQSQQGNPYIRRTNGPVPPLTYYPPVVQPVYGAPGGAMQGQPYVFSLPQLPEAGGWPSPYFDQGDVSGGVPQGVPQLPGVPGEATGSDAGEGTVPYSAGDGGFGGVLGTFGPVGPFGQFGVDFNQNAAAQAFMAQSAGITPGPTPYANPNSWGPVQVGTDPGPSQSQVQQLLAQMAGIQPTVDPEATMYAHGTQQPVIPPGPGGLTNWLPGQVPGYNNPQWGASEPYTWQSYNDQLRQQANVTNSNLGLQQTWAQTMAGLQAAQTRWQNAQAVIKQLAPNPASANPNDPGTDAAERAAAQAAAAAAQGLGFPIVPITPGSMPGDDGTGGNNPRAYGMMPGDEGTGGGNPRASSGMPSDDSASGPYNPRATGWMPGLDDSTGGTNPRAFGAGPTNSTAGTLGARNDGEMPNPDDVGGNDPRAVDASIAFLLGAGAAAVRAGDE